MAGSPSFVNGSRPAFRCALIRRSTSCDMPMYCNPPCRLQHNRYTDQEPLSAGMSGLRLPPDGRPRAAVRPCPAARIRSSARGRARGRSPTSGFFFTAASGSTGNPVRAQNASRTCSHGALGRKNASKRPKCFAPSMARLPVLDLVADLEEHRAFPAAAVGHAAAPSVRSRAVRRAASRGVPRRGVRGRPAAPTTSARCPRPARRRTSSWSWSSRALASTRSLRMTTTTATFRGCPSATS